MARKAQVTMKDCEWYENIEFQFKPSKEERDQMLIGDYGGELVTIEFDLVIKYDDLDDDLDENSP